ncbi:MAG: SdpI family protein [Sphingomonadaceae bacterium]
MTRKRPVSWEEQWLVFVPFLLALIGFPLAFGLIGPNSFYGYRSAASMASEAAWYRANHASGTAMVLLGVLAFLANLKIRTRDDWSGSRRRWAYLATLGVAVIGMLLGGALV